MSHINLEYSTGIFLILLFLMGSGHILGMDGESLLLGGTF